MPSSLLPGRGWRASWRADRANVDSSAARAGTLFAAAWFSLCQFEDAPPEPSARREGRSTVNGSGPHAKGRSTPKRGAAHAPARNFGAEPRPPHMGRMCRYSSKRTLALSEYDDRKDQRLHQAQSSNLDELRSLDIPITGFRAAEGRLGGSGHAARACQCDGNNKNQRSHPISPEAGSIGRNF